MDILKAVEHFRDKDRQLEILADKVDRKSKVYKAKEAEFKKTDNMWIKRLVYQGFINKLVPIIGSLPVQSPSFREVSKRLPKTLSAKDGNVYTREEITAILGILHRIPNRGDFVKKGSPLYPRYAGMTPLVMYAFREIQGIAYSYWDKEDRLYDLLLNSTLLVKAIEQAKLIDKPSINEILEARQYQLDNGKPLSSHTRPIGFAAMHPTIYAGGMAYGNALMQTWICQPGTRVEDAMILDFYDLDNVPEPIETLSIVGEEVANKPVALLNEFGF